MYWIQWAEKTFKHSCLMNGWRWLALVGFEVWPFPDRHSRGQGRDNFNPQGLKPELPHDTYTQNGEDWEFLRKKGSRSFTFYILHVGVETVLWSPPFLCEHHDIYSCVIADDSLFRSKGYLWLPTIKSFSNNIMTPVDLVAGGTRITFISLEWRQSNTRGDWIVKFGEIFRGKRWKIGVEICRSTKT